MSFKFRSNQVQQISISQKETKDELQGDMDGLKE